VGYLDVAHATDLVTVIGHGICLLLCRWCHHKLQTTITTSSTEAEFVASPNVIIDEHHYEPFAVFGQMSQLCMHKNIRIPIPNHDIKLIMKSSLLLAGLTGQVMRLLINVKLLIPM
jgi:hypothetical protein